MNLGYRIRQRREQLNMTMQEVADIVGVSKGTVQKWESGNIKNMRRDKIVLLAKALKISPLFIMGIEEDERTDIKRVPILGTIAAGTPTLAVENIESYFLIDESVKADFALRVKGDSMINIGIYEGDIAFIKQQPVVENGEVGAVLINGEATLKRIYVQNNSITLVAENAKYPPKTFTEGDIRILGKLLAVLHNF